MSDKRWKRAERLMARDVGTERIPVTGLDRHGADFKAGPFHYQLKHRKSIPSWLFDWLSGICATAGKDQTGVLVLNQPGRRRTEAVVIITWQDWCDLHGVPAVEATEEGAV